MLIPRKGLATLTTSAVAASLISMAAWTASTTPAAHADLTSPAANGGVFNIFTEADNGTNDPAHAIHGTGFWGHEDANQAIGSTFFSADMTDAGAAVVNAFQVTDPTTQIGVAFVQTTADGSKERPSVSVGEKAGDAFEWFTLTGLTGAVTGNLQDDSVLEVSDQAEWTAWINGGGGDQYFTNDLVLHDAPVSGTGAGPVSTHPRSASILKRWPAGSHISLVYFAIAGWDDANRQEPIVKRGADGRAITAWVPFTTVASPTRSIATSAGYQLVGPAKPYTKFTENAAHTQLTVSFVNDSAGALSPPAAGTVQFYAQAKVSGAQSPSGPFTPYPGPNTPVSETDGTATIDVTGLSPGDVQTFKVAYTPAPGVTDKYDALAIDDANSTIGTFSVPAASPSPSPSPSQSSPSSPSPTVSPAPSTYTLKLAKDQAALKAAKKALKKAKGAKKKKLKKKIAALTKAIKVDHQQIAAGHRVSTLR